MRYVSEFRNPDLARRLIGQIKEECGSRTYRLMEICGGHTHAFYRFGLVDLLYPSIELVHGPGCPVCVLPTKRLDQAIAYALNPKVLLATYGDMMRVPGSRQTLVEVAAQGADVQMVYSPLDALALAQHGPEKIVIFFAIGFETTAPATAVTLLEAKRKGLKNFLVFCNHVRLIPAIIFILDTGKTAIDGFIGPGHVSTIIGAKAWRPVVDQYGKGVVISGFEPLDLLQSVWMLVRQIKQRKPQVEVQYRRSVRQEGNPIALGLMEQTFDIRETFEWRGLGWIPKSGFEIRDELALWDAERMVPYEVTEGREPRGCICGDVLRGVRKPWDCPLFGKTCTPQRPIGACMVSSEGACAAVYLHGRHSHRVRLGLQEKVPPETLTHR